MTPILSYFKDEQLPSGLDEARKIKKQTTRFTILNDVLYKRGFSLPYLKCIEQDNVLYKRGFSLPYLKCVEQDEAKYILDEVDKGICRDHSRARSLVGKIIRAGYFWPMM